MARPIIALLTDFGTRDQYVGVLKGVIAGICPDALTIDLTHHIPPQDVRSAAFVLEASWREFPRESIFLVVVDPGVGTGRAAVAARLDERLFVGPDNGVFDLLLAAQSATLAVSLDNDRYARSERAKTFEGRDRFAPAAAWLASGVALEALGRPVELRSRLEWRKPTRYADHAAGHVVHVDHYGNVITDLRAEDLASMPTDAVVWIAGQGPISTVPTYGAAPFGSIVAVVGSTGRLEIAQVGGSAAQALGVNRGAEVHLRRSA